MYQEMSDDELLNVACDFASLEELARIAITNELRRRNLSEVDIGQYQQDVDRFKPEDIWGEDEHITRSMNGCGTAIYGKRDFEPDGSFLTTKWFVAFFVPVVPLGSMRVRIFGSFFTRRYLIRERFGPHPKQIVCVYSYVVFLAFIVGMADSSPILASSLALLALPLPWLLRRMARARASRAIESIHHGVMY
jgi:hypothetical protein